MTLGELKGALNRVDLPDDTNAMFASEDGLVWDDASVSAERVNGEYVAFICFEGDGVGDFEDDEDYDEDYDIVDCDDDEDTEGDEE